MTQQAQLTDKALEEASAWRIALTEHDQHSTSDFEKWLDAAPANRAAWDQVQAGWNTVGRHADGGPLYAMRQEALLRAGAQRHQRQTRRRRMMEMAACLVLLVCVGLIVGVARWWEDQPTLYATALAERRVITLEDQSRLTLDSNSEVEVRYSGEARKLVLLRGQARFDVAKDSLRPFSVRAGNKLIVATGTAFSVDMAGTAVVVTLIEGRVSVLDAPAEPAGASTNRRPEGELTLSPGQQAVALVGSARVTVAPVSMDKAVAWEQGLLVFEDEPLSAVTERVSRYSARKIIADPSVAGMKISGVFKAGDTDTFVEAVSSYLPVDARQAGPRQVRLTKRS